MKTTFCLWALAVSLTFQAHAESNTINILDGVTTNVAGPFTLGDTGPFNFLLITNGGALTNATGTIGNSNTAFGNLAIITGPGSVWASAPSLTIGVWGASNQVSVLDGAKLVSTERVRIGNFDTSIGNRLLVSGGSSYLGSSELILSTYGSDNSFIVEQGARVGLGSIRVNSEQSAVGRNRVMIRHSGSMVSVNGGVSVDSSPNNLLSVSGGATLTAWSVDLGSLRSGNANLLDISGPATLVVVSNGLSIGQSGSNNVVTLGDSAELRVQRIDVGFGSSGNQLRVGNGGRVVTTRIPNANASLAVGSTVGGTANLVSLHDPGTIWSNSGYVIVGSSGSRNALVISNGAVMVDTIGSIGGISAGGNTGSTNNRIEITGAGSLLSTKFGMSIGGSGSRNSLLLSGGGRLHSASADIGQMCNARDNLAFITGAGTVWSNGQLQVGFCSTNNHLVVSNGAQVFTGLVRSSVQGGASNTFTVTGAGSLLRASSDLIVGNSGRANSLLIADGGRVEGRNDRVGLGGANNAAFLRGAGSSWSNQSLTIGDTTGGSHLMLSDGARIDSGGAMLGADAKSYGNRASLSGANTAWNITTNLMLGGLGRSNELSVADGASVSAWNVYLGAGSLVNPTALYNSDWNSLSLEGANSALIAVSNVSVGANGRFNRLQILDGARVNDIDGVIGVFSGSRSNSVLVTGRGATWNNVNNLIVGRSGSRSKLTVSRGGRVNSIFGYVGFSGESDGAGSTCLIRWGGNAVVVTDPDSIWENAGPVYVGYGSIGNMLVVSNGGTVRATNIIIGYSTGVVSGNSCERTNANLLIVDGGCLIVSNVAETARCEPRSGTLIIRSGLVIADEVHATGFLTSRVDLLGGTLRVKWGRIQNGLPLVVGDGLRNGHLEFADPPYWGAVKFRSDDGIVVQPHARMSGVGTIDASVTNAGTISPGGAKPGSLSLTRLSCLSQSRLHIDIAGRLGEERDYLSLSFAGTLDGSLTMALRNGFVPSASDTFRILDGPVPFSGGFTNVPFGSRLKTTDNLGSFLLISNVNHVELRDYQSTDLDGDNIEDAWAADHFGHSPLTPAEKLADADGDGLSNYDEFRAGTDPNDPASALKLSIEYAGGAATMSFPCVDGKEYRVWSSNDLETWTEVSVPTLAYPLPGRCEWTDGGKDTGGLSAASRFYRVTVE